MSRTPREYHHGRSPAAWVGVSIAGAGFVLAAIASVLGPNWPLVWLSVALVLGGLVIGTIMKLVGYGNG